LHSWPLFAIVPTNAVNALKSWRTRGLQQHACRGRDQFIADSFER